MQLRSYQQAAIDALYAYLRAHDDHPCVVIPTAGGKTPVLATICKDAVLRWEGRVLIVAHVKELLEQAVEKLRAICPEVPVGIYSAGLKCRDTLAPVIVGGIQSIYKRACELGRFDLVVIDEAHLIPVEGDGMYRSFLSELRIINPHLRVVGLTATPYRLKSGSICGPDHPLNAICYEVGVKELIRDGFLCPLISKSGTEKADLTGLHARGGEFISQEVERVMDEDKLVEAACHEMVRFTQDRRAVLVFASGVAHGKHIAGELEKLGQRVATVFGDTLDFEREQTLGDFKAGRLKFLVNVNVLTTGFDAPCTDCVVLLRPTLSPGLYYQQVGRGFRLHPTKKNCLVLDYGGNVLRHGPVDLLNPLERNRESKDAAPAKECPRCHSIVVSGFTHCPDCGFAFPPPQRGNLHAAHATSAGILSGQVTVTEYSVREVLYSVHRKRGAAEDAPKTMRVEYRIGLNRWISEWICLEHRGYARAKAEAWWKVRTQEPLPASCDDAVELANAGVLRTPLSISVRKVAGEPFDKVVACNLEGCLANATEPAYVFADDEIPF